MKSNRITIVTLLALSLVGFAKEQEAYSRTVSVKSLLKSTTTSEGKPLSFPADTAEVDGIEVTIPAGSSTGWHSHAHSGFGYVLSGRLQVTTSDSTRRVFGTGEAFAEVVGTSHEGTALGKEDVKLVAFFLVQKGKAVSTRR
jgi:quercetin dioxygenase-like cupin family protein